MNWLTELFSNHESIARTVLILSAVVASGLSIGSVRVAGISLGIAGVLFTGLGFGHFGLTIDAHILEFAREFGLVLFVYTIGIQVGPSFFASFRKQGIKLNLLAGSVVLLGVLTAVVLKFAFNLPLPVAVGLLSGAVTNTPGLGAAQQALKETAGALPDAAEVSGMAYAVAYPFGIIGIILTMLLIRKVLGVNVQKEAQDFEQSQSPQGKMPDNYNLTVSNPRLEGQPFSVLNRLVAAEFVVSRLLRGDEVIVPTSETRLQHGDVLHVVCTRENAENLAVLVGDITKLDVRSVPSDLTVRSIVITHKEAAGQTIGELDLMNRYGVAVTRVQRAGIELLARTNMSIHFGDRVTVVGEPEAIKKVASELGDSMKQLQHPNLLPVFLGLIAGVLLGSIPFAIPGVPAPVKLGMAGGPLLVALILSRVGKIGPIVWYMPASANLIVREIGITLFLAAVGLKSGGKFIHTLVDGPGLTWMMLAALITLVPLLIVGFVARLVYKLNFLSVCGLLSGSMTDPPALSFANQIAASEAPSITYASVYAFVMFLRILTAQALVLLLT